jgi:predicted transcriptional regulator
MGGSVGVVKKTTIYLPEGTERRMLDAARWLGKSRAEMTREALEQYLDRCDAGRGLPESVGMGENPRARAATYEDRLAEAWGRPR